MIEALAGINGDALVFWRIDQSLSIRSVDQTAYLFGCKTIIDGHRNGAHGLNGQIQHDEVNAIRQEIRNSIALPYTEVPSRMDNVFRQAPQLLVCQHFSAVDNRNIGRPRFRMAQKGVYDVLVILPYYFSSLHSSSLL